jgi:hypothetical protein
MHEMSIALEVCRLTEEQVGAAGLASVVVVALEVGDDAGVEIGNLEFCLEALLSRAPFGRARPVINRTRGDVLRLDYLEIDDDEGDGDADTNDRGAGAGHGEERRPGPGGPRPA